MTLQDQNSRSLQSASLIHLSKEQNTEFAGSYSNAQVMRGQLLSDSAAAGVH